jgi:2'-5' RNA ligase
VARLFFAAWPDASARAALATLAHDLALVAEGKPVDAAKLHLTLVFLGEVLDERVGALYPVAQALRAARLRLVLDRVGSFRRSRVAWAGIADPPAALMQLQVMLETGLRAAGFAFDERPFHPHVTLTRKAHKSVPVAAIDAIAYPCDAVALVRSDLGKGTYTTLESWPLA